jgi:hypothetical protein
MDLVYSLFRAYMEKNPEAKTDFYSRILKASLMLNETATTGIQVQIIDTAKLKGCSLDPGIVPPSPESRNLIINIDYAFGEQAEDIILNLIMLFSCSIESINILGKAGALVGDRGDILIPNSFIEQTTEHFYPLRKRTTVNEERLKNRLGARNIFTGPMLTVPGTVLQNRTMLKFYKNLWSCIGLEMEGAWYYRQIQEAKQLGVIIPEMKLRIYYYVSDFPLSGEKSLASPLKASEGIPPLYAISREILTEIFEENAD